MVIGFQLYAFLAHVPLCVYFHAVEGGFVVAVVGFFSFLTWHFGYGNFSRFRPPSRLLSPPSFAVVHSSPVSFHLWWWEIVLKREKKSTIILSKLVDLLLSYYCCCFILLTLYTKELFKFSFSNRIMVCFLKFFVSILKGTLMLILKIFLPIKIMHWKFYNLLTF